ncbi:thioesterase family protein [Mycobacterium sp. CVI_P3]|uniref:Thioesterase family protein n=1 Tax=Mycobacterium pinniadriaticum TaxID=2994102 RepID=A0ABT3SAL5_9MYCO|nr:acyl-CoA thioesterase domain-containing protein [Mycobacterium pinniadriaticum]MCX2929493.1 thioesterase family protein [Mycobacterium pinniadriaticum]MCX2935917.1 thioesterase family protein [Mycobacterium pinniadriaticum]
MNSSMDLSERTAAASSAMGIRPAYFVQQSNGGFRPTTSAAASWSDGVLSGQAIAGLAASTLERKYGAVGYLPARLTLDLLKPARAVPTHTQTRLIRQGHRMRTAECDIIQDDWIVARATLLQYRQTSVGAQWVSGMNVIAPDGAEDLALHIDSDGTGWVPMGQRHHSTGRKRAYYGGLDAVAGLAATPFVRSAVVAEAAANLVTDLGASGMGYVNGDLTVALARLPRGVFIGVQADTHFSENGVSVGNATLFDDDGAFGSSMVTAMAGPAVRAEGNGRG